jgi:hypothetical protein
MLQSSLEHTKLSVVSAANKLPPDEL